MILFGRLKTLVVSVSSLNIIIFPNIINVFITKKVLKSGNLWIFYSHGSRNTTDIVTGEQNLLSDEYGFSNRLKFSFIHSTIFSLIFFSCI